MKILEITELLSELTNTDAKEITANLTKKAESGEGTELKSKAEVESYLRDIFSKKFKSVSTTNQGRATKEARSAFEKEIREELGYEGSETGLDLVKKVVEREKTAAVEASSVKLEELTEVKALQIPAVQNIVNARLKEKESKIAELEGEINTIKTTQTNNAKREIIRSRWLGMNPILSDEAEIKQRQISGFINTVNLNAFKLSEQNGEKILTPINENGEQLVDTTTFNPVTLDQRLRQLDFFGFHEQDPSKGSPSPKSKTDGTPPSKEYAELPAFENRNDLMKYLNRNRDKGVKHLEAVSEKFEETQKK